jgi:peroxiredoxin
MAKVGDKAPDLSLLPGCWDQDGENVSLSSLQGHKVLVYFYP